MTEHPDPDVLPGGTDYFPTISVGGCFIEAHACPDCDRECQGGSHGTHYCEACGIEW